MDVIADAPKALLISINVMQMLIILVLLLPVIDIVSLSKLIKDFKDSARKSPLIIAFLLVYGSVIIINGILIPTKIITELKHSKQAREGETPEDILRRVITCTNACRNFILGAFSLFYLLVIIRLFEYVTFSAKLHEFSELMANYDLIDIALVEPDFNCDPLSEEKEDTDEEVPWPITANLNKAERSQIRTFLRDPPKKLSVLARKAKGLYEKTQEYISNQTGKDKLSCDPILNTEQSNDSSDKKLNSIAEEIFEIEPDQNKEDKITEENKEPPQARNDNTETDKKDLEETTKSK